MPFSTLANQFETAGERHIVWLGPDEYLLLCESGKEKALYDTLTSTIKTSHFAITDVSDSLCALSLSGAAVRDVLAKGCSLDFLPLKIWGWQMRAKPSCACRDNLDGIAR